MSFKKRLLRFLLTFLLIVLFAGYFGFSTFLFSPLEGGIEGDLASIVPRDVDYFVAKAGLAGEFDHFPRLKAEDEVERSSAWTAFVGSQDFAELDGRYRIRESLRQVEEIQAQIPLGYSLPDIFGGKDLAVAGYIRGNDFSRADWAVYGHVRWPGKLAVSMLSYPGLIGSRLQGVQIASEHDYAILSGPNLPRELYVARIKDVAVVSTSTEMIKAAIDLEARGGEDSFGQSARYFDHVASADRNLDRDELEFFLDVHKYLEAEPSLKTWPNPRSDQPLSAYLGHVFQLGSIKELVGLLGFGRVVSLDLHGELTSELVTPMQASLYRWNGFDRTKIFGDIARLAPADSCLFLYLQGKIGDQLRMVMDSLEKATRELVVDRLKSTGAFTSLDDLVKFAESSTGNRLALIVRPNDYPVEQNGPPNDGQPVFVFAIVTWTEDKAAIEKLREDIGNAAPQFGLQGRNGETGYYKYESGGYEIREYWSQMIPGTGAISTGTAASTQDTLTIVTNHFRMIEQIFKTFSTGGRDWPRLADRDEFVGLVNDSLHDANVLLWLDPRSAAPTLKKQLRGQVELRVRASLESMWPKKRRELEVEVIPSLFPGKTVRRQLSPQQQEELQAEIDSRVNAIERELLDERIPQELAAAQRRIDYLQAVSAALLLVSLDPKHFDLSLRARVPLD